LSVKRGLEVVIYKDKSFKEAVQHIVDGKILDGLHVLRDRIHEIKNDEARFEAIADFYTGLPAEERADTVIVTTINRDSSYQKLFQGQGGHAARVP
jgi:hypothetical protein